VATHSPIIMAYPHAKIYVLREDRIEQTEYTDTEHFAVSRSFLMDHRGRLRHLLGE
jgi:predicted ATPase